MSKRPYTESVLRTVSFDLGMKEISIKINYWRESFMKKRNNIYRNAQSRFLWQTLSWAFYWWVLTIFWKFHLYFVLELGSYTLLLGVFLSVMCHLHHNQLMFHTFCLKLTLKWEQNISFTFIVNRLLWSDIREMSLFRKRNSFYEIKPIWK
jgi:hypothetical protein